MSHPDKPPSRIYTREQFKKNAKKIAKKALGKAIYEASGRGDRDRHLAESTARLDVSLESMGGYRVGSDTHNFIQEKRQELLHALEECRKGNLDNSPDDENSRPWALILHEHTIDPYMNVLNEDFPLNQVFGIDPEKIGSTEEEIYSFWIQREANKANRWIEECRNGDLTHAHGLNSLVNEYGDDFISKLSVSVDTIKRFLEERQLT